jgi:hypothetical protein
MGLSMYVNHLNAGVGANWSGRLGLPASEIDYEIRTRNIFSVTTEAGKKKKRKV